ncbi:NAD(P)-dependent alcohol dehydrogenase [Paeniglutamicibacter kerguelensis]|uniref:alcohol dehydrogenase (NADP(+)) n=1 Tax=Paeniglutamicibacter kerguelensis TaxID=254788 RepID=A0ABS4XAB4_9MICC|nr:NAD(P)-dependent alcohol dehydrogenase [Paeniglutamicibacter kerguelensis]MBP2385401.1 putative zinc-type alcohol dehydrogenase-like protein [Paeniglutamicibacter kerguelensis]
MIGRPVPPPHNAAQRINARAEALARQAKDATDSPPPGPEKVRAMGIVEEHGPLTALEIERRQPGARDVVIELEYCGLCHSDVHAGRGEWGATRLPLVPGHEMVGIVREVGGQVRDLAIGARVGVGCLVDSCRNCDACREGLEQFCRNSVGTYGATDPNTGEYTQGGYSQSIVVNRDFVLRIPDALDPAAAAPLLCAGITSYSPLRHHKVGTGSKVGVLGLGGLGHMAVKLAGAMGASVTVFTRSEDKRESALALGAETVVNTSDAEQMKAAGDLLNLVIDTVSAPHDIGVYLRTLKRDGALVQLSLPAEPMPAFDIRPFLFKRLSYTGSPIGSIAETQEMLDFCAEHGIASDIELTDANHINEAWDRMVASDVKYRFVLDIATLGETAKEGA